jgi:hypothetical protein
MLWVHDTINGNAVQSVPTVPSSGDWDEFGVTFTATATASARIHLYDFGGSGALYWDHVQVTPVTQ